MTDDPRFEALRDALGRREPRRAAPDPTIAQAAVLLALRPAASLELLLIQRAEKEGDPWSGHMALPGGRREVRDRDLLDTALRETVEETAISVPRSAVIGALDEMHPGARRRFSISVAPYVAVVPAGTEAVPAPAEVEAAIWIPLPHLDSEEAVDEILVELEEGSRSFPALSYQDYVIWGLTHRILVEFIEIARTARLL